MGRGYHYNIYKDKTYFMTMTVVDWIDLFTRLTQKHLIVDSLKYCPAATDLSIPTFLRSSFKYNKTNNASTDIRPLFLSCVIFIHC